MPGGGHKFYSRYCYHRRKSDSTTTKVATAAAAAAMIENDNENNILAISIIISFFTGLFVGGSGHYLWTKYTDRRRQQHLLNSQLNNNNNNYYNTWLTATDKSPVEQRETKDQQRTTTIKKIADQSIEMITIRPPIPSTMPTVPQPLQPSVVIQPSVAIVGEAMNKLIHDLPRYPVPINVPFNPNTDCPICRSQKYDAYLKICEKPHYACQTCLLTILLESYERNGESDAKCSICKKIYTTHDIIPIPPPPSSSSSPKRNEIGNQLIAAIHDTRNDVKQIEELL